MTLAKVLQFPERRRPTSQNKRLVAVEMSTTFHWTALISIPEYGPFLTARELQELVGQQPQVFAELFENGLVKLEDGETKAVSSVIEELGEEQS